MKKLIVILLTLVLITNLLLAYLLMQNNRMMEMLLHKESLFTPAGTQSGNSEINQLPEPNGEVHELMRQSTELYLEPDGAWHFEFTIKNTTDTDLYIYSLDFIDNGESYVDHRDTSNDPALFEMIMGPDYATKPLRPGETLHWGDGHPGEHLTDRTYLFTFINGGGERYTAEFQFQLLMEVRDGLDPAGLDYANDNKKDLLTLRYDANFGVEVAPDVFWVPARTLGDSRFSNADLVPMVFEAPDCKQREIETLYEALQLYQISGFAASDDNIRMTENGINWEHHKPGYDAVATNNGCCATSANWLNYILAGDYEEVGFVATSQRDGSGHIYNYIFHEGWYYFIDLTHYRTDWIATAVEDGDLDSYYRSDFILGNLHQCRSVEAFVRYVQDSFNDPPGMMFRYTAEDCLAIDSPHRNGGVVIVYEDDPNVDIQIIFDDPNDALTMELAPQPQNRPNW